MALGVYLALLAAALATLLAGASSTAGRTAVAACFVAMVVHSMGYAGFLTDPATWALLALGWRSPPADRSGGRGAGPRVMLGYLRRLATTGAAYTASSVLSKLIAVALLPLYTRYLTPADYGAAEVMFGVGGRRQHRRSGSA